MFDAEQRQMMGMLDEVFEQYHDADKEVMQPGHNGPYDHPESPLRVTSHWLVALSRMAQEAQYRDRALARISVLHSGIRRFHETSLSNFVSREQISPAVDAMNGTIGAAWVFEGLSHSLAHVPDPELKSLARAVYSNHTFSRRKALWHRCYPNGKTGRIDQTFNHQLWFAYGSASLFAKDAHVRRDVELFLTHINRNMGQYNDGLIYHPMPYKADWKSKAMVSVGLAMRFFEILRERSERKAREINYERDMYFKSIGYHTFNLFALGGLRRLFPSHELFTSDSFARALCFIASPQYRRALDLEDYFGYRYNLTGLECLSILRTFQDRFSKADQESVRQIIERQFELMGISNGGPFPPRCFDANTYVASCYKALI